MTTLPPDSPAPMPHTESAIARGIRKVLHDLGRPVSGPIAIIRTYAGRNQRSAGAWSWSVQNEHGLTIVGSCDAASAVIAAHRKGKAVLEYDRIARGWELHADV